jgi:hypothetical protein
VTADAASHATYVYCIVQSVRSPSLRGIPDSVPGAGEPRALQIDGDLWAIVADAPLDRFSSDQLERDLQDLEAVSRHALAHAAVVEFMFRKAPLLPLQLFTLFSGDARVRQDLARRASSLRTLLLNLRGLEEWGVRISVNAAPVSALSGKPASGRDYLATKKRLLDRGGAPAQGAIREAGRAMKSLKRLAVKVRKQALPPPGRNRPIVSGASFLVPASKRAEWKKQVGSVASQLRKGGHQLDVTGPWPPYHFTSPDR